MNDKEDGNTPNSFDKWYTVYFNEEGKAIDLITYGIDYKPDFPDYYEYSVRYEDGIMVITLTAVDSASVIAKAKELFTYITGVETT